MLYKKKNNYTSENNPLKNAPHTIKDILSETWDKPYSRAYAAFPLPWIKQRGKFWPTVGRVDNVRGDKNPVCVCGEAEDYIE